MPLTLAIPPKPDVSLGLLLRNLPKNADGKNLFEHQMHLEEHMMKNSLTLEGRRDHKVLDRA